MNGSDTRLDEESNFSCPDEVAKRIAQLYEDPQLADVTFVVRNGERQKSFSAHKNIICTWSQPLKSMLCGNFAEGLSEKVVIQDVEPSAFEAMLQMMYKGTVAIDVENVLAILDVSVRFDVTPLLQFSVQFLQNHTSSEHACRMLEVGVQYGLVKLQDKCIELIVTDEHILGSEDFNQLSQAAVIELAKHDSWNTHEDDIFDTMVKWGQNNRTPEMSDEDFGLVMKPILQELRYPHMTVEKLKILSHTSPVPSDLIFEALFFKLNHSGLEDAAEMTGRYRPRPGSLLFSWVPTSKVTVSGDYREGARHTSSNGFTGVRGDRRMQHGVYSWSIDIAETQSSWIFVGVAQADDPNDVAWRSSGYMLYCLDSRYFHQGSSQNHPQGDRKIQSGDCIRVELDCSRNTLAFGVNTEKPIPLFRDLPPVAYVSAVDLRDCGDKVRIVSSNPHVRQNPPGWCNSIGSGVPRSHSQQPSHAGPSPSRASSVAAEVVMYNQSTSVESIPQASLRRMPEHQTPMELGEPQAPLSARPPHDAGIVAISASGGRFLQPHDPPARRPEAYPSQSAHAVHGSVSGGSAGGVGSASGHPSHSTTSGGSNSRTLQPRQSQQGGQPTLAAQERSVGAAGPPPTSGGAVEQLPLDGSDERADEDQQNSHQVLLESRDSVPSL